MIFDPLVGYISDNFRSKWGRRIPFIAVGCIPLVLCTIALFYPPAKASLIPWHLSIVGSLFFIFYTIVGAPYNALIPEISQNYEDRLNLSTWQSVFWLLYTAVAMIAPGILMKSLGNGNPELGLRKMVIYLSLFALAGMIFMVFTVNETSFSKVKPVKTNFKSSMRVIFKDKSFIYYLLGLLFFFIGFNTLRTVMNYFVEDVMGLGKEYLTIVSAILFGCAALFFYPINRLAKKIGYRKPMLVFLLALIFLSLALFQLGKTIPTSWGFIIFALIGIPVSGAAFIFPPAMLSEIVTLAKKENNLQSEGFYFGIQGFFLKMAFLVSVGLVPILLTYGENVDLLNSIIKGTGAVQLQGIYLTTLLSALSFFISFIFYFIYPEKIMK